MYNTKHFTGIYKQSIEYRNCLQKIITFRSVIPLTIIQKL